MQRETETNDDIRHFRSKKSHLDILYIANVDENQLITHIICNISVKNIIAYAVCQTFHTDFKSIIYVCDLISPWRSFKVFSSKQKVSTLEWNSAGNLLLIGFDGGNVEIWKSSQYSINSWLQIYQANFLNENVLSCTFFNMGKVMYFNSQKKDLSYYRDKFDNQDCRPTLTKFGNTPTDGCIFITKSGLLAACRFSLPHGSSNLNQQNLKLKVSKRYIGMNRGRLGLCNISHLADGSLNFAITYEGGMEIYCMKVVLKYEQNEVCINFEFLPTLFVTSNKYIEIVSINGVNYCKDNILHIAYNSGEGSALEQWKLVQKHESLQKVLQKNKTDCVFLEVWERIAKQSLSYKIREMHTSKLSSDFSQIYIIFKNNIIQVFDFTLKKVGFGVFSDERDPDYKLLATDVTHMDQILIYFDKLGKLYASQIQSLIFDKNLKLTLYSLQISFLEYCIISGVDANDIFLINLPHIDVLIEKLTENFLRQPPSMRQYYYSNFLRLKSNMYRITSKQQDFDHLITLHSISITFKSLLRPSDLSCQDKGPADNLAIILSEPLASDVDKVLFNLDAKDYTVEPITLQSLQQLIQWVVDLALNILSKLPEEIIKIKMKKVYNYEIGRDVVAISIIRELLVMIRVWGLLNSQCLPMYMKFVDNLDVLAILFRLLTRLVQNPIEPDETLLDECSLLSSQILIPRKHVYSPVSLYKLHPNFDAYPFIFSSSWKDFLDEGVVFSNSIKDGITNINLGCCPKKIKKCMRCGLVTSVSKVAKSTAIKAWCNRWMHCHCGGFWEVLFE